MQRNVDSYFKENKPYSGLGRASLHGGLMLVAARLVNAVVQIGSTVLVARQLEPRDFGLVAIVLALVSFAPIVIDLGTTDASTQKSSITRSEISSLFWLNVVLGGGFTLLFAGFSRLIASIFGDPALTGIALASSMTFLLTGLAIQHYALMRRAMEFQRIALIDISANIASSVISVMMAFTGWDYWALVAKPLLTLALTAVGAWIACPWMPGRPGVTPEVTGMVRFGLGITGFAAMDQLTRSADRLALGYMYGSGPLGYFQNAFLLYSNMIAILAESLHNVAVSGLSKLRNDVEALKRSWSAALSTLSFAVCPAFAILAVTGTDFVVLLLGDKWAPAGPLLCIFALRGIPQCIERTIGWLHVVAGRSDRWMRWGFISTSVQIVALAAGLPFGPTGVATSYAIAMFALFVPAVVYAGRPIGIGAKDVLAAAGWQAAAALLTVAVGYGMQEAFLADSSRLARFLISASFSAATYLALAVGVFRVRGPVVLAISLLRDVLARKAGPPAQHQGM